MVIKRSKVPADSVTVLNTVRIPKNEQLDNTVTKPSRRNLRHGGHSTGKTPLTERQVEALKSKATVVASTQRLPKAFGVDGVAYPKTVRSTFNSTLKVTKVVSSYFTWLHDYNISSICKNIYNALTNTTNVLMHVDISLYEYAHLAMTSHDQKVKNSSYLHHKVLQHFDLLIKYKLKDTKTTEVYKMYKVVSLDDQDIHRCFKIDEDRLTGVNLLSIIGSIINISFPETLYYDMVVPGSHFCSTCNPVCPRHDEVNCGDCKIACGKHFNSLRTEGVYDLFTRLGRNTPGRLVPTKDNDSSRSHFSNCGSLVDHWYVNHLLDRLDHTYEDTNCITIPLPSFTYDKIQSLVAPKLLDFYLNGVHDDFKAVPEGFDTSGSICFPWGDLGVSIRVYLVRDTWYYDCKVLEAVAKKHNKNMHTAFGNWDQQTRQQEVRKVTVDFKAIKIRLQEIKLEASMSEFEELSNALIANKQRYDIVMGKGSSMSLPFRLVPQEYIQGSFAIPWLEEDPYVVVPLILLNGDWYCDVKVLAAVAAKHNKTVHSAFGNGNVLLLFCLFPIIDATRTVNIATELDPPSGSIAPIYVAEPSKVTFRVFVPPNTPTNCPTSPNLYQFVSYYIAPDCTDTGTVVGAYAVWTSDWDAFQHTNLFAYGQGSSGTWSVTSGGTGTDRASDHILSPGTYTLCKLTTPGWTCKMFIELRIEAVANMLSEGIPFDIRKDQVVDAVHSVEVGGIMGISSFPLLFTNTSISNLPHLILSSIPTLNIGSIPNLIIESWPSVIIAGALATTVGGILEVSNFVTWNSLFPILHSWELLSPPVPVTLGGEILVKPLSLLFNYTSHIVDLTFSNTLNMTSIVDLLFGNSIKIDDEDPIKVNLNITDPVSVSIPSNFNVTANFPTDMNVSLVNFEQLKDLNVSLSGLNFPTSMNITLDAIDSLDLNVSVIDMLKLANQTNNIIIKNLPVIEVDTLLNYTQEVYNTRLYSGQTRLSGEVVINHNGSVPTNIQDVSYPHPFWTSDVKPTYDWSITNQEVNKNAHIVNGNMNNWRTVRLKGVIKLSQSIGNGRTTKMVIQQEDLNVGISSWYNYLGTLNSRDEDTQIAACLLAQPWYDKGNPFSALDFSLPDEVCDNFEEEVTNPTPTTKPKRKKRSDDDEGNQSPNVSSSIRAKKDRSDRVDIVASILKTPAKVVKWILKCNPPISFVKKVVRAIGFEANIDPASKLLLSWYFSGTKHTREEVCRSMLTMLGSRIDSSILRYAWLAAFNKPFLKTDTIIDNEYAIYLDDELFDIVDEDGGWVPDLTVFGIEPNPGPPIWPDNMADIKALKTLGSIIYDSERLAASKVSWEPSTLVSKMNAIAKNQTIYVNNSMFSSFMSLGTFNDQGVQQNNQITYEIPEGWAVPRETNNAAGALVIVPSTLAFLIGCDVNQRGSQLMLSATGAEVTPKVANSLLISISRNLITTNGFKPIDFPEFSINTDSFSLCLEGAFLKLMLLQTHLSAKNLNGQGVPLTAYDAPCPFAPWRRNEIDDPNEVIFGVNDSPIVNETVGGVANPFFPVTGIEGELFFHAALATIPPNERSNMIAIPAGLVDLTGNNQTFIALLIMMMSEFPFCIPTVTWGTTAALGVAEATTSVPGCFQNFIVGMNRIHVLLPLKSTSGAVAQNQAEANTTVFVQPTWGPLATGGVVANNPLNVSFNNNLIPHRLAAYLCSYMPDDNGPFPQSTFNVSAINVLINALAMLTGRQADIYTAWDKCAMLSIRYSYMQNVARAAVAADFAINKPMVYDQYTAAGFRINPVGALPIQGLSNRDFYVASTDPRSLTAVFMGVKMSQQGIVPSATSADFIDSNWIYHLMLRARIFSVGYSAFYQFAGWTAAKWAVAQTQNINSALTELYTEMWSSSTGSMIIKGSVGSKIQTIIEALTGYTVYDGMMDKGGLPVTCMWTAPNNFILNVARSPAAGAGNDVVYTSSIPHWLSDFWLWSVIEILPLEWSSIPSGRSEGKLGYLTDGMKLFSFGQLNFGFFTMQQGGLYVLGMDEQPSRHALDSWNLRLFIRDRFSSLQVVNLVPELRNAGGVVANIGRTLNELSTQRLYFPPAGRPGAPVFNRDIAANTCWYPSVSENLEPLYLTWDQNLNNGLTSRYMQNLVLFGIETWVLRNTTATPAYLTGVSIGKPKLKSLWGIVSSEVVSESTKAAETFNSANLGSSVGAEITVKQVTLDDGT